MKKLRKTVILSTILMLSCMSVTAENLKEKTTATDSVAVNIKDNSKTIDGHRFIDLALPSGLLWAETNVGAETAADVGCYFAWGETKTKATYTWKKYELGKLAKQKKYNAKDGHTKLLAEDDAASTNWGSYCRMPTNAEFAELGDSLNCTWTFCDTTQTDGSTMAGIKVTSKRNGRSIFLPATGYRDKFEHRVGSDGLYWSSSVDCPEYRNAWCACATWYGFESNNTERCTGMAVRPVAEP